MDAATPISHRQCRNFVAAIRYAEKRGEPPDWDMLDRLYLAATMALEGVTDGSAEAVARDFAQVEERLALEREQWPKIVETGEGDTVEGGPLREETESLVRALVEAGWLIVDDDQENVGVTTLGRAEIACFDATTTTKAVPS